MAEVMAGQMEWQKVPDIMAVAVTPGFLRAEEMLEKVGLAEANGKGVPKSTPTSSRRNPRSRWVDRWRASRPTPPCTGFMARRCPHGTSCPSMASRTLTEPNRTGVSTTERLPVLVPRRESRNGPALRRSLSLAGSSQPVKVLPPTPDELALR